MRGDYMIHDQDMGNNFIYPHLQVGFNIRADLIDHNYLFND